jgi:lipid A 4'-phosphatase
LAQHAHRARLLRASPVLRTLLWLGLAAALALLSLDGRVDLWVSGLFFQPGLGFPGRSDHVVTLLRGSTRWVAIGITLWLAGALLYRTILDRPLLGLSRAGVVYLVAVFLLLPGLLVNGLLKEHWGRARPAQTVEFGGARQFSLAILPADQCDHNCSFVSGEASLGFAFAAFGFVALRPARRRLGLLAGIVLGSGFGLLRIAQGGHFLSDVVYAGLLTIGLAWLLHRLLIEHGLLERAGLWLRRRFGRAPGTGA